MFNNSNNMNNNGGGGYKSNNYHNNNMNRVPKRIYVGSIPDQATQDELREHFSAFGTVVDARIITDPIGQSRGYGFITFENENEASHVLGLGPDELTFKETKLTVAQAFRNQRNDNRQPQQQHFAGNNGSNMHHQGGMGGGFNPGFSRNNAATFGGHPGQQMGGVIGGGGGQMSNLGQSNAYRNNDAFRTDDNSQFNNMRFAYDQQYSAMGGRFF